MRHCVRAAIAASLVCAASAAAQTPPSFLSFETMTQQSGRFYISLGGGAAHFALPRFNAVNHGGARDFAVLFDEQIGVTAVAPVGTLGFVLYDPPAPSLLSRVRFEISAGVWSGRSRINEPVPIFPGPPGNNIAIGLVSIDARDGVLFGTGPNGSGSTELRTQLALLSGAARLRSDIRLGERLTFSPFIGFVGEWSRQDYRFQLRVSEPDVATDFRYDLDESLDTRRLGGEAGGDVGLRLGQGWMLRAGGSFAMYHQHTRFSGNDCFTSFFFGNAVGGECVNLATRVTQSDGTLAWRAGASLGLDYVGDWLKVSFTGNARFDSKVPGIRNPVGTQTFFLGGTGDRPVPAAIYYSGQWSYGGHVMFTIALP